jgi:hypothetical protein
MRAFSLSYTTKKLTFFRTLTTDLQQTMILLALSFEQSASTNLLTYLLTPWSRVLLEKLTVNFAASQEIPRIYGTRKFLTVSTSARHLSLSFTAAWYFLLFNRYYINTCGYIIPHVH